MARRYLLTSKVFFYLPSQPNDLLAVSVSLICVATTNPSGSGRTPSGRDDILRVYTSAMS